MRPGCRKLSGTRTPWSSRSLLAGREGHVPVAAGEREQKVDERGVVVEANDDLGAAEAAEVAREVAATLDDVSVGVPGRVRRDDDHRLGLADVARRAPPCRARWQRPASSDVAADLGDEQRRVRADAALHGRLLPLYARASRPRERRRGGCVDLDSTIAPGSAAPAKFTVTFWRVRPRSPSPCRLGPSTRTSTLFPTQRRARSPAASSWVSARRGARRARRRDRLGHLAREVGGRRCRARGEKTKVKAPSKARLADDIEGRREVAPRSLRGSPR